MQLHVINKLLVGGAETVASDLARNSIDKSVYTLLANSKKQSQLAKRFGVTQKSFASFLRKYANRGTTVFSHNLQAHIAVNFVYLGMYLFFGSQKPRNVIHFDVEFVSRLWLRLFFISLKLTKPKLIFVSEFAQIKFEQQFPLSKYEWKVIHNSISDEFFDEHSEFGKVLPPAIEPITIGFIGRHAPVKRLDLFIETFFELCELTAQVPHLCVQSDIPTEQLHSKIRDFKPSIPSIVASKNFKHIPSTSDPREFYQQVDVVISTSKTETFGLVALECFAHGKRFYSLDSECFVYLFNSPKFNIKAKTASEFAREIKKDLSKEYTTPNLERFTKEKMLASYAES